MTALLPLDATDPLALIAALRSALDGGPAVLPLPGGRASEQPEPAEVQDGTAVVIETSGSSGAPKRVQLSARALLASATATEQALGGPGTWLLALPGHYIAGVQVVVRALVAGGEPRLLRPGPFVARDFADAVAALPEGRSCTSLVPTQVLRLVEAAEADAAIAAVLRRLAAVLVGGARFEPGLRARAEAIGLPVVATYGSSETAGGCVYDGRPLPGVDVRVQSGEVWLAGPTLADGYLEDPERTARSFVVSDGVRWYRTGDAGIWDGDVLRVTGRLDDVIVSGGEKVSLALVERAVRELPGLDEAVVVRMPHAAWGEVPVVVTTTEAALDELRAHVGARLGRAARPYRVLRIAVMPHLASGKPDRVGVTALVADAGRAAERS